MNFLSNIWPWWTLSLALLSCHTCLAQQWEPLHQQLTTHDGLPTNRIYDVLYDQKGYLWLATDRGPVRYDGLNLTTLPDYQKPVFDLREDHHGRIWFAGFDLRYVEGGRLKKPHQYERISEIMENLTILDFDIDSADQITFSLNIHPTDKHPSSKGHPASQEPILYYQVQSDTILTFCKGDQGFSELRTFNMDKVKAAGRTQNYTYYSFKVKGIPFLASKTNDFAYFSQDCANDEAERYPSPQRILFNPPIDYLIASDGTEWTISKAEVLHEKGNERLTYICPSTNRNLLGIFEDRDQNIWFYSLNGLWLAPKGDLADFQQIPYLKSYSITGMAQDDQGTLWLSTLESGLLGIRSFELLQLQWSENPAANTIHQVKALPHSYLFLNQAVQLYQVALNASPILISTKHNKTSSNIALFGDSLLVTALTLTLEDAYQPPNLAINISLKWFRDLVLAPDGTFWGSMHRGFYQLSADLKDYLWHSQSQGFNESPHALAFDQQEQLWVGGRADLIRYTDDQFLFTRQWYPKLHEQAGKVVGICPFGNDQLLVAKHGVGLFQLKFPGETGKLETQIEAAFTTDINMIYLEGDSLLWLATDQGIQLLAYNPAEAIWRSRGFLNQGDGMLSEMVHNIDQGEDYYAASTEEGLVFFRKDDLSNTCSTSVRIHLERVTLGDTTFIDPSHIDLPKGTRQFVLHYTGITFRVPQSLMFRYRLIGQDSSWQYTTDGSIQYTNLPPGDYRFDIQARTRETNWTETQTYPISLTPTLTQTAWYKLLRIALVVIVTFLLAFSIFRTVYRRQLLERRMNSLSLQALHSQMSPHFIFNALNSILYLIRTNQGSAAGKYLTSFSRLIRSMLEDAEEPFALLIDELDRSQQYLELEQLQYEDSLTFQINIAPHLQVHKLFIPRMMLQPFLENAIKHGIGPRGSGHIEMQVANQGNQLVISIEDDGIGRLAATQAKKTNLVSKKGHLGIENTSARIHNINYLFGINIDLRIIDLYEGATGIGTRIELSLPKITQPPAYEYRNH